MPLQEERCPTQPNLAWLHHTSSALLPPRPCLAASFAICRSSCRRSARPMPSMPAPAVPDLRRMPAGGGKKRTFPHFDSCLITSWIIADQLPGKQQGAEAADHASLRSSSPGRHPYSRWVAAR